MNEWSRRLTIDWAAVDRLLAEPNETFIDLVRAAGLDPARDFRFADLRGVDFGEVDLFEFDLTGANCEGADLSRARELFSAIRTNTKLDGARLPSIDEGGLRHPAAAPIREPSGESDQEYLERIQRALTEKATILDLRKTELPDLEPLRDFARLQLLSFDNTRVANLEPLRDLAELRSLSLDNTRVESLEPLRGLARLQWLSLNNTPIESVEPLRGLAQLQWLWLNNTPIESVEPLRGLAQLQELWLTGTRVSSDDFVLQELKARGVKVYGP